MLRLFTAIILGLLCAAPALAQMGRYNDPPRYNPANVRITGGTISGVTVSGITLTLSDSIFTLQDNADATKQLRFELSGISTGTTRTLTVPNASGTLLYSGGPLGTPASGVLTSATGLPISSGLTGAGTGVLTALGVNVGSAGAFVTFNGAGGTPSSVTLTNGTGLPIAGITGLGTNVATALGNALNASGGLVGFGGALGAASATSLAVPLANAGSDTAMALANNSHTTAINILSTSTGTQSQSSGTTVGFRIAPTYDQSGTAAATDLLVNRVETAVGSGAQNLLDLQVADTSKFRVDNVGVATIGAGGALSLASKATINTAPTIAAGLCTSPSISASNGTAAFAITVGTSCTGVTTGTLTMPAATTGWVCHFVNVTNPASNTPSQTGGSTTTVTFTNYARTTGVAADFAASDSIRAMCVGY